MQSDPKVMNEKQTIYYDLVITGASGNIGRHLIPILACSEGRILALGRNGAALQKLYAGIFGVDVAQYDDLDHIKGDTLIHLAVHNNNQLGSIEEFTNANVEMALRACQVFKCMDGRRFINIASIQSLNGLSASPYAISKEAAQQRIAELVGGRLDNIHIGYFYGDHYFGQRLSWLGLLGSPGGALFALFKMLKPATSAQSLVDYIERPMHSLPVSKILTDDLSYSWLYRSITRMLDVLIAIVILIIFLPIFAVLGTAIRLESSGPAIFAQSRVGKEKVIFKLYKFRTMKRDTVVAGTHEVSASAVTKMGKFLRRTKLDELPQAINLIRGEMTLIGPRPCLPSQRELIEARDALGVYSIRPGITGYAQIRGIDMSRPYELAQSDYIYMKLQSFALNLKILFLTILGRGYGDHVAIDTSSIRVIER